ncbi:MAG TPA: hypothetical protein VK824_00815 [Planctomycetota bacterium]|nr:hypothetical protein [Planctomycetota bacterium]
MSRHQTSLLSGEEIKEYNLVENASDELYRASTYDLSIGEIVRPGSGTKAASVVETYDLPPGGTVRVVSRECFEMPDWITGHVLLKNELCTRGILAINIGIVDPGFRGPISSTLINFGKTDFPVRKRTPFLRVSFHRCPPSPRAAESAKFSPEKYLARVHEEVQLYSAETFLSISETTRRAANQVFGDFKKWLLIWVTVAGLGLAIITVFVPMGASWVERHITGRDERERQEAEQLLRSRLGAEYDSRLEALSKQIEDLRKSAPKGSDDAIPKEKH